jgi:hypothetical protein
MKILLDKPFSLSDIENSDELDIRNVSTKNFHVVLKAKQCINLSLYNLQIIDLAGIDQLPAVRHLKINWATKIKGIEEINGVPNLETLELIDLPKLRSIEPLIQLKKLRELKIGGGIWKPISLESLGPLGKMRLQKVSITNIRLDDDSVKVLAQVQGLSELDVSNQFPREQYSYLAAKLNQQLKTKIQAFRASPVQCPTCKENKFMFMGRRMPFLCRTCEKEKFDRHRAAFDEEVQKWSGK